MLVLGMAVAVGLQLVACFLECYGSRVFGGTLLHRNRCYWGR